MNVTVSHRVMIAAREEIVSLRRRLEIADAKNDVLETITALVRGPRTHSAMHPDPLYMLDAAISDLERELPEQEPIPRPSDVQTR